MREIHPTAIIDPSARLGKDVTIGPYAIVGKNVVMGEGNVIMAHAVIGDGTHLGDHNRIHPFASIGGHPQSYDLEEDETCRLVIGSHNNIYEYCTLNRGTTAGGKLTKLGDHNLLMAYVHVGHDAHVGNHTVLINHATLGGHVHVHDHAVLSAFVAIRQCCVVGTHAFVTRASKVSKDVLAHTVVQGNPPKSVGINRVGLQRRDFTKATLECLDQMYRIVFTQGLTMTQAIEAIKALPANDAQKIWLTQLKDSERGLVR